MIQTSEIEVKPKAKPRAKPRNTYDSPWKSMLNRFLQEFMEFCFPKISEEIDWSKEFIPLDKELRGMIRDQETGNQTADALFKVWLKNGQEIWVLLHIEVQGKLENDFEERMFIYNYRGFDQYKKPVFSIAILTDESPNWRPTEYKQPLPFAFHTSNFLHFGFSTVKLLDYVNQKEALLASSNPFAIVIWAHLEALKTDKQDESRFQSKMRVTRALYDHGFSKTYIQGLFLFIDWVLHLSPSLETVYFKKIQQLEGENQVEYITSVERIGMERGMQKGMLIGIEKGIEKGMQKGEAVFLIRLLEHRFGRLSDSLRERIQQADSETLLLWGEKILDINNLDDLFE